MRKVLLIIGGIAAATAVIGGAVARKLGQDSGTQGKESYGSWDDLDSEVRVMFSPYKGFDAPIKQESPPAKRVTPVKKAAPAKRVTPVKKAAPAKRVTPVKKAAAKKRVLSPVKKATPVKKVSTK